MHCMVANLTPYKFLKKRTNVMHLAQGKHAVKVMRSGNTYILAYKHRLYIDYGTY